MYMQANKQDDSNSVPGNVEDVDDLAQFRNQWKKELTVKTVGAGDIHQDSKEVEQENQEDDVHRKVKVFYEPYHFHYVLMNTFSGKRFVHAGG